MPILYTAQTQKVLNTINSEDVYYVKKEYILSKYQEVSGVFLIAYDWFSNHISRKLPRPSDTSYPVWLFKDPAMAMVHPDQHLLKLRIPDDQIIFFSNKGWEKVLSLDYVPENEADDLLFKKELTQQGLDCSFDAIKTPYYPLLKREIQNSWSRVFDGNDRAASWCIKKEWIIKDDA